MLYNPGLTFGELSGRAGHTIASKGPYGTWISIRGSHTVRVTQYTQASRASFRTIQKLFATLGPTDLTDWTTLGLALLITGRLERQYSLTAASTFVLVNRNLYTIGASYVTTAPALTVPVDTPSLTGAATAPPTGSFLLELTISPDPVPASTYYVIYGQKPKGSVSNTFSKRGWKVIAVLTPGDSAFVDVTAGYLQRFTGWYPGDTLAIKVTPISAEGFQGTPGYAWVTSA